MAKIAFIVEYTPNPEHYPDCETIEECVAFDVECLNDGSADPLEFLSYKEIEVKEVPDDE